MYFASQNCWCPKVQMYPDLENLQKVICNNNTQVLNIWYTFCDVSGLLSARYLRLVLYDYQKPNQTTKQTLKGTFNSL